MRAIQFGFVFCLVALFACGDNKSATVDGSLGAVCSDGIDNDGDGKIDFPDDLGCESANGDTESAPVKPQCQDNRDNDGDGKIDYPNDPGCPAALADDELDDCPNGAGCPQCSDGKDNDGNGKTDFPSDSGGCMSAADMIEFTDDPNACGAGMVIKQLPTNGMDMGALTGTTSTVSSPCGGGNGLPAVAYIFHLLAPKVVVATTDDPMTMIDTVLDLRTSMCTVPGAELACHDDILASGTTPNRASKITKSLPAGTYYLVVGGKTMADTGQYAVKVETFPGEGAPCTMTTDCGPGLDCKVPNGQTQMVCAGPACNNLRDDDGDGKKDFPVDPGCTSTTDDDESDGCYPTVGPTCPACANGMDDDSDTFTDYPADTGCPSASFFSENFCSLEIPADSLGMITTHTTMATLATASDNYDQSCQSNTGNDVAFGLRLSVPLVSLQIDTIGSQSSDTVVSLWNATCSTSLGCDDDGDPDSARSLLTVTNVAAGDYAIQVDSYSNTHNMGITLNVSGTVALGTACTDPLFASGVLACEPGLVCTSGTCALTACNDAVDNDGDGKISYPDDPGCTSRFDNDETDDCPAGPNCPACGNGMDDDSDTFTDFPADPGCASASSSAEFCSVEVAADVSGVITAPTTTSTLATAADNYDQPCQSNTGNDRTFALRLPVPVASLQIDTIGSQSADTVVSLWNEACATSLGCDDDGDPAGNRSLLTVTNLAAGSYAIQVDSYSTGNNMGITLNVSGTVTQGTACTDPLFAAGVLACEPGTACTSGTCAPAACRDTADNDGDGKIDYPNDPGCTSTLDTDETDDCPAGPNCPVCANGVDDDSDTLTDFPSDPGCSSASSSAEFCSMEVAADVRGVITAPTTTSTLATAADNYDQSCQGNTGNDVAFGLRLPVPVASLQIDTIGSQSADTVVSLWNEACSTSLGCDDDGDPASARSLLTVTNVAAGSYAIQVDAYSTSNNTGITLNVRGTVAAGTACTDPLFAAGVLSCPMSMSCTSGTCQ